jgi:predicted GNAT family N-acyltransferase
MTAKRTTKKQAKADAQRAAVENHVVDLRANVNDPSQIGRVPGPDIRCVLELARAIHRAENTSRAISWSAQERAQDFYNTHGMYDALTEMFRLQAIEVEGADA